MKRTLADQLRQRASHGEMLTINEVARILRVHPNSLRRWGAQGLIKVYRVGNRGDRRFRPEDVARFLESSVSPTNPKKGRHSP